MLQEPALWLGLPGLGLDTPGNGEHVHWVAKLSQLLVGVSNPQLALQPGHKEDGQARASLSLSDLWA